jgi:hypothetical protein
MTSMHWLAYHRRLYEYYGGVPAAAAFERAVKDDTASRISI